MNTQVFYDLGLVDDKERDFITNYFGFFTELTVNSNLSPIFNREPLSSEVVLVFRNPKNNEYTSFIHLNGNVYVMLHSGSYASNPFTYFSVRHVSRYTTTGVFKIKCQTTFAGKYKKRKGNVTFGITDDFILHSIRHSIVNGNPDIYIGQGGDSGSIEIRNSPIYHTYAPFTDTLNTDGLWKYDFVYFNDNNYRMAFYKDNIRVGGKELQIKDLNSKEYELSFTITYNKS